MTINSINNFTIHHKRCSMFVISIITIGVFVINFTTCLAVYNVADYVKLKRGKQEKRATVSEDICETAGCVTAASSILNHMDVSVKPCDDFYKFSCGNFIKNAIIPDDKSKIDAFTNVNDKLQEQLRISIQEGITENDPRTFQLLKSYYKTCMNTALIEKNSYDDFREVLKKLGGWPVLDGNSWNESNFDWKKSIYKLRNLGYPFNYFISFRVEVDIKSNNRRIINLDQASLGLSQEYLSRGFQDKIVQAYFKFMIDFSVVFGSDIENAKKEFTESLNFEIELAKICLSNEKRRDLAKMYNPMSVKEIEFNYPGMDWLDYSNNLLAPHTRIDLDERVILVVPNFFKDFVELIKRTPKRVLANYLLWRIASDSISALGEQVQRISSKFETSLMGTNVREPRWKECIGFASNGLFIATGALYVRRFFDESSRTNTINIIQNISKSFKGILMQVNWMDQKTREAALEKIDWIVPHIAYPTEFLDDKKLDEFYKFLKIYPESFYKSQLSLNLFNIAYGLEHLRKPINKTDWIPHGQSAIVNAFYDPTENSILFPAGILQGQFFANDRPKYLNYGAIGYIMGHEITHGFDDEGRQFDKNGNLVEWWETETKKKYLQRAKCIIDQYNNYTVKEVNLNLNGLNTQGENIADNGGIKEAYLAYNNWELQNGPEPRLPGLNYTSQQMFWISAANVWCNKSRPEALKTRITIDVHSPGEFRVVGPISNMPEFSKDFNCPLGSAMNPLKKCTVW